MLRVLKHASIWLFFFSLLVNTVSLILAMCVSTNKIYSTTKPMSRKLLINLFGVWGIAALHGPFAIMMALVFFLTLHWYNRSCGKAPNVSHQYQKRSDVIVSIAYGILWIVLLVLALPMIEFIWDCGWKGSKSPLRRQINHASFVVILFAIEIMLLYFLYIYIMSVRIRKRQNTSTNEPISFYDLLKGMGDTLQISYLVEHGLKGKKKVTHIEKQAFVAFKQNVKSGAVQGISQGAF